MGIFEEADKYREEKDKAEGFARGVDEEKDRKDHPLSFPISEAAGDIEEVIRGEDYTIGRKAGHEYERNKD